MKPENGMLVRINLDGKGIWDTPLANLLNRRVLVPVERCKHGRLDGHCTKHADDCDPQGDYESSWWCLGAEIGDNA